MSSIRVLLSGVLIVCSALLVSPLLAETKDVFAFIPAGGRTLFAQVVASHPPADELQAILTGKRTRGEWLTFLKSKPVFLSALITR
jgi:hypothetical protein